MDWKLLAVTFGTVFLAELGDKTQLATASLAASSKQPLAVLVGAGAALLACTVLAVAVGAGLSHVLPLVWLRRGSAVLFVAMGILLFFWKAK